MKKVYISPKALCVNLECESLMQTMSVISETEVDDAWTQEQNTSSIWDSWSE